jgi:hypothetical protein
MLQTNGTTHIHKQRQLCCLSGPKNTVRGSKNADFSHQPNVEPVLNLVIAFCTDVSPTSIDEKQRQVYHTRPSESTVEDQTSKHVTST